ncbi:hypothetical protein [Phytohabitans rumicis]|uniref:DUF1524 domain-containing protein n=1 Tax=Phytohabitans rumicis TaxID=1076125 RepID=A0A6V8L822_9ACTN|nr:hypothetical protein [Phytohabitans rumicis]GFJ93413.1 hypothetical protein Prum_070550 [Phytohabitans rumicis]
MVAAAVVPLALIATPVQATPPNIPSYATALGRLNTLTVAAESHQSTYDRDLFPHWGTITGSCNTREQVLKRDGTSVNVDSACYPTSGSWRSPYDGATWTNPADVDIDHMVPLSEAWASGAWAWTTARRQTPGSKSSGTTTSPSTAPKSPRSPPCSAPANPAPPGLRPRPRRMAGA